MLALGIHGVLLSSLLLVCSSDDISEAINTLTFSVAQEVHGPTKEGTGVLPTKGQFFKSCIWRVGPESVVELKSISLRRSSNSRE